MTDRIYLAVPYTHPDPKVRRARFEAVTRAAGELMKRGHVVLMLPGWEQSRGVEAEIAAARENGVPIEFLNPDEMRF